MSQLGLTLREITRQNGVNAAVSTFREGVAKGRIKDSDIRLGALARDFLGDDWYNKVHSNQLREAVEAIDASAFQAIGGQFLIDRVRQGYREATKVGDKIFATEDITNKNLGPQREPWLSDVQEEAEAVQQLQTYPATEFTSQFVDYPGPQKYGRVCHVSMEMIWADKTQQAAQQARTVGKRTGIFVEKQKIRVAAGITNNHEFNDTAYNTYLSSGAWTNLKTDWVLVDWTDIDEIEQMFNEMSDPVTGEPIDIEVSQILSVPAMKMKLRQILRATTVRTGSSSTNPGNVTESDNPIDVPYELMISKYLRRLLVSEGSLTLAKANTAAFFGDFKRAFLWRQVFPVQVFNAAPGNMMEYMQDVALSVKARVYGIACVRDPRFAVKAYNNSAS